MIWQENCHFFPQPAIVDGVVVGIMVDNIVCDYQTKCQLHVKKKNEIRIKRKSWRMRKKRKYWHVKALIILMCIFGQDWPFYLNIIFFSLPWWQHWLMNTVHERWQFGFFVHPINWYRLCRSQWDLLPASIEYLLSRHMTSGLFHSDAVDTLHQREYSLVWWFSWATVSVAHTQSSHI